MCGSGLGAFIFNPFSKFLIDSYGWRGAILIEAGIILNCVLCGALFRPLLKKKTRTNKTEARGKESAMKSFRDAIEMELFISGSTELIANGLKGQEDTASITLSENSPLDDLPRKAFLKPKLDLEGQTFSSDGALHNWQAKRNASRPISPLALEPKPPQLQRMVSADAPPPRHRHIHHHLTPGIFFSFNLYAAGTTKIQ